MRLDAHYGMLPERAFEKRGFGNRRPSTLEGGGKGGGGGPSQTTAYQTNLPEYAKPYVMNMLGAAQNELFNTTTDAEGNTQITGFKPYQPFSTDPTKYFAQPTALQGQVYGEATGMQTPGQFGSATGLAGQAGSGALGTVDRAYAAGQLGTNVGVTGGDRYGSMGAGYGAQGANIGQGALGFGRAGADIGGLGVLASQQGFDAGNAYERMATDPRSIQSYMSPFMQNVVDTQKAAAVRDYQMMVPAMNAQAVRAGAFGGSRDALMRSEAARNLSSQLQNIQAQGQQQAFQNAQQAQQFRSNLGLQGLQAGYQGLGLGLQGAQTGLQGIQGALAGTAQGIQGAQTGLQGVNTQLAGTAQGLQGVQAAQAGYGLANQAAATMGNIGAQQQQADLARMQFQNQLAQQQQQFQQGIINQQIQDYATAQQYPFMQLSTMSNLLRGLPMQGMTTQQYQAQPSTTQQLIGLGGTAAMMGRAGLFKKGGQVKSYAGGGGVRASLENRVDDIADAGGVKGLQKLMTETQSPEAKRIIAEKIRELGIAAAPTGDLGRNMAGGGIVAFANGGDVPRYFDGGDIMSFLDPTGYGFDLSRSGYRDIAKEREEEARRQKEAFLAENAPEALAAMRKREAEAKNNMGMTESSFKDFDQAQALFEKERFGAKRPAAPAAPAAPGARQEGSGGVSGLSAFMAERKKALKELGIDGEGEKSKALMQALEERAGRLGKEAETDKYLRAAQAFAQFGSTAGPIGKSALGALGEFAKGEAGARRDQEKLNLEVTKMQADLEKAQRAEARGDLDAAQKAYDSYQERKNRVDVANQSANRQVELIERAMKDPEFMDALRSTKGLDDRVKATAVTAYSKWLADARTDPEFNRLAKAARSGKPEDIQALENYKDKVYMDIVNKLKSGGANSGVPGGNSGKVDTNNPLLKG